MSTAKTVVSMKDLSVQRGGTIVLEGVNLEVRAGDFVGLSGPNGSGKSTLLLTIIGELEPELGSVTVFGDKPGGPASRGRIAWISQAASQIPSNLRISVRELVSLGTTTSTNYLWPFGRAEQQQRVEEAIRLSGMEKFADRNVQTLSGGQRQRAVIARGLATNAEMLLLDEPLVGVDRASRNGLLKLLDRLCREEGKTIIMVTHDQGAIHHCTQCAICIDGNVRYDESHASHSVPIQAEVLATEQEYPSSNLADAPKEWA